MKPCWTIRLSAAAERDYREILRWTAETSGRRQANTYARTLSNALRDLALGPSIRGARPREDVGAGIHTLHVAREGRKGRHLVVFRANASSGEQVIDVLRLLHDCMDLPRHLPAANGSDPPGSSQR